jgi:hypothetical protein
LYFAVINKKKVDFMTTSLVVVRIYKVIGHTSNITFNIPFESSHKTGFTVSGFIVK